MRNIPSTFLSPSCPFSAFTESALRALLHGTGATLHSAEVPSLPTPITAGPMLTGQELIIMFFLPNNSVFSRSARDERRSPDCLIYSTVEV